LSLKQSQPFEYEFLENSPEQLALIFLSHFIDAPMEELEDLEITKALSQLIYKIAEETLEQVIGEPNTDRTLH
jgi:hypothetical protein